METKTILASKRPLRLLLKEEVDRLIHKSAVLGISRQQMQTIIDRAWRDVEAKASQASQMEHST